MNQKNFFLISFLPALAYWYLESHYDLKIALIGGFLLGMLEIILEKVFTGHVHSLSKMNIFLIILLGIISYLFQDGVWFKLQPFFTGLIMGGLLLLNLRKNESYLWNLMEQSNNPNLAKEIVFMLEKHLAFFLMIYGCFMAILAIYFSTNVWTFFKTAGLYIVFALFMVLELFYIRKFKR